MSIYLRYSYSIAIVFVWSLIGFPLLASSINVLGITTSGIIIAARAVIALLCATLIMFSLVNQRSPGSVLFRLMLLFMTPYLVRIAHDTMLSPALLGQPKFFYWAFAIGVSFLPALALSLLAKHLDLERIFIPLMAMGMAVLAFAIIFGSTKVQSLAGTTYDTGRLALESLNPITLGHVGTTVVLLVYWRLRMLASNFATLALWLGAALFGLYGVLASGSRGPLVALICGVMFFEAVKGGRALIILSILSLPVLAVLTIDVSRLENALGTNIFSRLEAAMSGGDASSIARVDQLSSAWKLFLDHPLVGAGLEDPTYGIYPHNIIVEAFMALGIMGGALLLIILFMACLRAFHLARSNPAQSAYGALFVQYMVAAQLSGGLYGSSVLWALLACIAGLEISQIARTERQKPDAHRAGQRLLSSGLPVAPRVPEAAEYNMRKGRETFFAKQGLKL